MTSLCYLDGYPAFIHCKQTKPCFYSQFFVTREYNIELKQDIIFQGTARDICLTVLLWFTYRSRN